MDEQKRLIYNRVNKIMSELNSYISYLYIIPCSFPKHIIYNQLKCKIEELQFINSIIYADKEQLSLSNKHTQPSQRTFTLDELAKYNGKNGNPAYVAIDGAVYDVTNNAAWAAATHFGLSAGRDLTNEFASCHAGQSILNNLRKVGNLIS